MAMLCAEKVELVMANSELPPAMRTACAQDHLLRNPTARTDVRDRRSAPADHVTFRAAGSAMAKGTNCQDRAYSKSATKRLGSMP